MVNELTFVKFITDPPLISNYNVLLKEKLLPRLSK